MDTEYTLTVIEDMETPLASGVGGHGSLFYIGMGMIVVAIILIVAIFYYVVYSKNKRYYMSICEKGDFPVYSGVNVFRLKEAIMEAESRRATILLDEDGSFPD